MQHTHKYHGHPPNEEEFLLALKELEDIEKELKRGISHNV